MEDGIWGDEDLGEEHGEEEGEMKEGQRVCG